MRFCAQPGCGVIVQRGRCEKHKRRERDRPNVDVRAWYQTPEWRAIRARVLREQPRCAGRGDGLACGRLTTDVDHTIPHRGDRRLFLDRENLRAKCHACHSSKTGRGQ
jgi:5-methylcytosine-specific restriction enzyme A